jgi:hypothetical protein
MPKSSTLCDLLGKNLGRIDANLLVSCKIELEIKSFRSPIIVAPPLTAD